MGSYRINGSCDILTALVGVLNGNVVFHMKFISWNCIQKILTNLSYNGCFTNSCIVHSYYRTLSINLYIWIGAACGTYSKKPIIIFVRGGGVTMCVIRERSDYPIKPIKRGKMLLTKKIFSFVIRSSYKTVW